MKKHAIIPIFISHRGCPNQCVFCNQKLVTARDGDVTPSDVINTAESYLSTLEGKDIEIELSFFGGSFTGIPMEEQTEFLKIAKEYKDAGRISKIHCSTRPDYINKEILDNLKKYSMDVIELGVQSFDESVLSKCKRGHSLEDVYKACSLIKEYGFTLGIQLMIGLPGDSYESCLESAKETVKIKPSIARLYPTVVLAGTELADMYDDGSYIPPKEAEMIHTVKDMYKLLTENDINVIRIGLKSNDLIKGDTYHPAIGQVVKSELARDTIVSEIDKNYLDEAKTIEIYSPPELFNYAVGHKASNKKYLEEKYKGLRIRFIEDKSAKGIFVKVCR